MEKNTETLIAATEAANPWAAAGDTAAPAAMTTATEAASPWGAAEPAASPWGATEPAAAATDSWLSEPAAAATDATGFQISQLWDGSLPIQSWINDGLAWTVDNFRPFFQTVRAPIDATLGSVEALLLSVPTLAMVALLGLIAWQCAGRAIAIGGVISLLLIAMLGIWPEAMVTLSLVMTSLVFCLLIGLPLGIALAASDRANRIMRPVLDAMQTTPAFVYLVPVVMLFGIGNVPGVIVTIVFALPPLVRLTTLGIRQVRPDLIEAARSYGASPMQLLTKVQLPLAMPSIMAGINQTLMLSLSMVVIASMIAVGGLGQMVLRGIGRLDMGLATVGGLGIVLLAITLDRITQAMGQPSRGARHWWQTGPAGLVLRVLPLLRTAKSKTSAAPARPSAQTVAAKPAAAASATTGAEPQGA
jgi:glycine betaine/proline transport system permease protein